MNLGTPKFTKGELQSHLQHLNDELCKSGITGELCIVGGAVMVLGYGSRDSTRDIDALLIAPASVRSAISKVAETYNLPPYWLNDGAKGFASTKPIEAVELLSFSNLRVLAPPAEYILAMKCIAARVSVDEHDKADATFLIRRLGLRDAHGVLKVVGDYYEESRIPVKTRYFVQEVIDELFPRTEESD